MYWVEAVLRKGIEGVGERWVAEVVEAADMEDQGDIGDGAIQKQKRRRMRVIGLTTPDINGERVDGEEEDMDMETAMTKSTRYTIDVEGAREREAKCTKQRHRHHLCHH